MLRWTFQNQLLKKQIIQTSPTPKRPDGKILKPIRAMPESTEERLSLSLRSASSYSPIMTAPKAMLHPIREGVCAVHKRRPLFRIKRALTRLAIDLFPSGNDSTRLVCFSGCSMAVLPKSLSSWRAPDL